MGEGVIGATPTKVTARLRPAALLYLSCVVALAVGGGLLGVRLLQAGGSHNHVHAADGPPGLGVPAATSFGSVEVERVDQIRGLTPKSLAGVTHGIHGLVQAGQMQVQMLLALRNTHNQAIGYDPADFDLRLAGPGGTTASKTKTKTRTYASVSTSVQASRLPPRSEMETTVGFVVPRFNPKGTRLSLEFRERGRPPLKLDLGRVRPGGSLAAVQAALSVAHHNH